MSAINNGILLNEKGVRSKVRQMRRFRSSDPITLQNKPVECSITGLFFVLWTYFEHLKIAEAC